MAKRNRKTNGVLGKIVRSQSLHVAIAAFLGACTGVALSCYVVVSRVEGQVNKAIPFLRPKKTSEGDEANVRVRFGKSMCSATIVGPFDDDAEAMDVLTAAHCVGASKEGIILLSDGTETRGRVVAMDVNADVCWLKAVRTKNVLRYALLADAIPPPGASVYHCGFGRHNPGNREEGIVLTVTQKNGQTSYSLVASPGDSGAGIYDASTKRLLSPLCCTSRLNGRGVVWGGSLSVVRSLRPTTTTEIVPYPYTLSPRPNCGQFSVLFRPLRRCLS